MSSRLVYAPVIPCLMQAILTVKGVYCTKQCMLVYAGGWSDDPSLDIGLNKLNK